MSREPEERLRKLRPHHKSIRFAFDPSEHGKRQPSPIGDGENLVIVSRV